MKNISKLVLVSLFFIGLFIAQLSLAFEPLKLGVIYPTTPMDSKYIGEDKSGSPQAARKGVDRIIYFASSEARENFRVVINDGIAYDHNGTAYKMTESRINYVMDAAGNFYFFQNEVTKEIRHSSMFAGEPVAAAGEMTLDANGKILSVDRASGHYRPGVQYLNNALKELAKSGVDLRPNH